MPRDEKECIDRILVACQRPGLAEKSQYRYARGGTDIVGPTIDLLEAIAQRWKNIEFGFRELARFPGVGGQPGESIVEAYSWDLESNVRRRTQFSVVHSIGLKGNKTKVLTDPRDIYEVIANQAQRRVRTCLENIIPRDVIEMAREECDKTLTAHVDMTPEALKKLVDAFSKFGVTKAMIETRIQRRLDTVCRPRWLTCGESGPRCAMVWGRLTTGLRSKARSPQVGRRAGQGADAEDEGA